MNVKRGPTGVDQLPKKTGKSIVVVPYFHGVTHRLKSMVGRQGVQVVYSAPNKANYMCGRVKKTKGSTAKN